MNKLNSLVLHPFFITALTVVIFFSDAKHSLFPDLIWQPLLIFEVAIAGLFCLLWFALKDPFRAGTVCTLVVPLFFSYELIKGGLSRLLQMDVPPWLALVFYVLLLAPLLGTVARGKFQWGKRTAQFDHKQLNSTLNIVTLAFLAFNAANLVLFENYIAGIQSRFLKEFHQPFANVNLDTKTTKRDVYYIVLDTYPHSQVMQSAWHYDNSRFINFLKDSGFYVVPHAVSNYDRTHLSVPSTLNMQYLDLIPQSMGNKFLGEIVHWRLMADSCVAEMFKRLGYKYINIASGSLDCVNEADINYQGEPLNYLTFCMVMISPLGDIDQYTHFFRNLYAERNTAPGKFIPEITAQSSQPKFVVMHTLLTHGPSIFGRNGEPKPLPARIMAAGGDEKDYVDQLIYSQSLVEQWIAKILQAPGPKPIIIIQSDHGPHFAWNESLPPELINGYYNAHMKILNAYYFPDMPNNGLYPTITPVNSFRTLFNDYFHANLPLLPDRSFCNAVDKNNGYGWTEVTKLIHF